MPLHGSPVGVQCIAALASTTTRAAPLLLKKSNQLSLCSGVFRSSSVQLNSGCGHFPSDLHTSAGVFTVPSPASGTQLNYLLRSLPVPPAVTMPGAIKFRDAVIGTLFDKMRIGRGDAAAAIVANQLFLPSAMGGFGLADPVNVRARRVRYCVPCIDLSPARSTPLQSLCVLLTPLRHYLSLRREKWRNAGGDRYATASSRATSKSRKRQIL